jgi:thiol-disulfide isomerase/thioredoxin
MTRKLLLPLAAAALTLTLAHWAVAQDAPQKASQNPPKNATQASPAQAAQTDASAQPEQPMSLADMARLARAKKQGESKVAKVFDDDNMPRRVYPAGDKSTDATTAATASQGQGSLLSEFRGKIVLLDFWASWCGPCRRALPSFKRLQAVYGSDQLVVVSISEDEDERTWSTFTANNQMTWLQRFDAGGSLMQQFNVDGLPTYILIGRDGTILQRFEGEDPSESIVERIGPSLKQALGAKS